MWSQIAAPVATANAVMYFRNQLNRGSHVDHEPGRDWASAEFMYPMVVTSAPIFVVDASETDLRPLEVPWATMTRQIMAKNVKGRFYVDVVNDENLLTFIADRVNRFGDQVGSLVQSDAARRFVTRQDHSYKP
jgi:hypothetical protein